MIFQHCNVYTHREKLENNETTNKLFCLILYKLCVRLCAYYLFAGKHFFDLPCCPPLVPSTSSNMHSCALLHGRLFFCISSTIHLILIFFSGCFFSPISHNSNARLTSTPEMRFIQYTVRCTAGFCNTIDCSKLQK